MPRLKTVRPKWALTVDQARALLDQLPWPLPRTLVGLALLTGLRRGELFALRWWDVDETESQLAGARRRSTRGCSTIRRRRPSLRTIPLPEAALQSAGGRGRRGQPRRRAARADLLDGVRQADLAEQRVASVGLAGLCRRRACRASTWLTFRRTYSSWAHDKGVPGEGRRAAHGPRQGRHDDERLHAGARRRRRDRRRIASDRNCSELFRNPEGTSER